MLLELVAPSFHTQCELEHGLQFVRPWLCHAKQDRADCSGCWGFKALRFRPARGLDY